MVKSTRDRVPANTRTSVNERIHHETRARIAYYSSHPHLIPARLEALDREWDIERWLETLSASVSLFGLARGLTSGNRRWFILPLFVQGFFLQHALQGWCPPLPVLRGMGIRTQSEIEQERFALEASLREAAPTLRHASFVEQG
jgi:hypothetical protein